MPLKQALISCGLFYAYVSGFRAWLFRFFMFNFVCLAPIKRLTGKIVSEMTCNVLITQLNSMLFMLCLCVAFFFYTVN